MAVNLNIETKIARLNGNEVSYSFQRRHRRTIGIKIDAWGVTVTAPLRASQKSIEAFIFEKADWILRNVEKLRHKRPTQRLWLDGEMLPFLGEQVRLTLIPNMGSKHIALENGRLLVANDIDHSDHIHATVVDWYRMRALELLTPKVKFYAEKIASPMPPFLLSNAQSQWGSCTASGKIRLNWRLVKAPVEQIDYVVAHEIAHLKHLNHSKTFWNLVEKICPGHSHARKALRKNSLEYQTF